MPAAKTDQNPKRSKSRPRVDSEQVSTLTERQLINALDEIAASTYERQTRPEAVRAILTDWLFANGFLKRTDHS